MTYTMTSGHVSIMPRALDAEQLHQLQAGLSEDDYPLSYNELFRLECDDPDLQLYLVRGWVPPHVDDLPAEMGECVTLGLVIEDSQGSLLVHEGRGDGLPLSPGCVYRIDPRRIHGTEPALSADQRDEQHGVFAFVAADFAIGEEPDPVEFASNIARLLLLDMDGRRQKQTSKNGK